MKILVINGPNINMLGVREPEIYGRETYINLVEKIEKYAKENWVEVKCFQSNHEGDIVDEIQKAYNNHGNSCNCIIGTHYAGQCNKQHAQYQPNLFLFFQEYAAKK